MQIPDLPGRWESPALPLPTSGTIAVTATHSRGLPPKLVRWVLVCALTEGGYRPGDELETTGYNNQVNPALWANAAQVGFSQPGTWPLALVLKNGTNYFAPTNNRWRLKCYAQW